MKITIFDPEAMEEAKKELGEFNNIIYADSALSCIKDQSVCFIATPWEHFAELKADDLLKTMDDNPIILDAWGILPFQRATSIHNKNSTLNIRRIGKNYK